MPSNWSSNSIASALKAVNANVPMPPPPALPPGDLPGAEDFVTKDRVGSLCGMPRSLSRRSTAEELTLLVVPVVSGGGMIDTGGGTGGILLIDGTGTGAGTGAGTEG